MFHIDQRSIVGAAASDSSDYCPDCDMTVRLYKIMKTLLPARWCDCKRPPPFSDISAADRDVVIVSANIILIMLKNIK